MKHTLLTLALTLITSAASAGGFGKNPIPAPLPPPELPAPACNSLSYDFVEAVYQHSFAGEGADGFGLAMNKSINDNLFGFADYNQFSVPDEWYLGGGIGFALPVNQCIDWVSKLGAVYSDTDYAQQWNGTIGTGFRMGLTQWLQMDVFYHGYYSNFEDYSNSGSAALIFREVIAPKVDIIVYGSIGEDDYQSVATGLRYNF
jgi:hypothetical protein